jgi:hypothetical protein
MLIEPTAAAAWYNLSFHTIRVKEKSEFNRFAAIACRKEA